MQKLTRAAIAFGFLTGIGLTSLASAQDADISYGRDLAKECGAIMEGGPTRDYGGN